MRAKRADEIACYSVDFFMDPAADMETLKNEIVDMNKVFASEKISPLGVNVDYPVAHFLYLTPEERNEAYTKLTEKGIKVAINIQTAYIDKKYLPRLH